MIQGRYLIVQPIGKGGMGEVYLAIDQRLGSAVALKRTFFSEDETLGNAFEREARILARLRHPVLPKVIDHFSENGDQFLVMEHISGDDIAKRLETAKKPFPLSWVMFWADQLLDALTYMHSHEPPIVHRDIKPQNLKLTDENHIVLLDFGLSKDFATGSNSLNSASVAGYSPHFASMEQIRGTGTDARSDLYSLSATLYQLLTGREPADALSRADALLGGDPDPIVPLNIANPGISISISDVILKGVSIRQNERYTTAGEMQKEMRRAFSKGSDTSEAKAPVHDDAARGLPPAPNISTSNAPQNEPLIPDDARKFGEIEDEAETKTALFTNRDTNPEKADPAPGAQAAAASASLIVVSPPAVVPKPMPGRREPRVKARSSRSTVLIGGVLVLLVAIAAAAGTGLYLYQNPTTAATSVPTPEQAVPLTPRAATAVEDASLPTAAEVATETPQAPEIDFPAAAATETAGKPAAANIPKAVAKRTAPVPKASPKSKPKDDRTVIEQ